MRKRISLISYVLIFFILLCSCGSDVPSVDEKTLDIASASSTIESLNVSAPGISEQRSDEAVIDYSNASDGYVMVNYINDTSNDIKVQVKGPETTYTYSVLCKLWSAFPLSEGNGDYQVSIYENIAEKRYALVLSADFTVELTDEFAPFLRPNQYVNFADAPKAVAVAQELTRDCSDTLEKVDAVYTYVIKNFTYDKELAANVKSGYLPVLDSTLEKKSGICFDYAALMTGMLRSLRIPCKLVVGYAGNDYHAWISVWVDGQGWIDNLIYFDGVNWSLMDPTFASVGDSNNSFIGDGSNYSAKYFY